MQKIIKWFLVWRFLLFIPILIGIFLLPLRKNSLYTTLWQYTNKYPIVENDFIYSWSNFDGVHYIAIASQWYTNQGRFLPLFPITIGVVAAPLSIIWPIIPYGPATFWSGIIVSTTATIFALYYLAKLLELDYKIKTIESTLLLLLISPTAFFLGSIYSEGLFLLLSVLSLFFARKRKWLLACITAMFLSITRLSGLLIVFPLLYEYYQSEIKDKKNFSIKSNLNLVYFAIIPLLLLLYSYFNYIKWGDFLYFVHAHGSLGNSREVSSLVFPLVTIYRYLKIFLTVSTKQYEFWIALLEFSTLIYASWCLFLSWREKLRPSYQIYAWAMISLPLLSGTLSGFPRYILPVFPFFLAQSLWFRKYKINKQNRFLMIVFVGVSILLQAVLLMLFARGYYVS